MFIYIYSVIFVSGKVPTILTIWKCRGKYGRNSSRFEDRKAVTNTWNSRLYIIATFARRIGAETGNNMAR